MKRVCAIQMKWQWHRQESRKSRVNIRKMSGSFVVFVSRLRMKLSFLYMNNNILAKMMGPRWKTTKQTSKQPHSFKWVKFQCYCRNGIERILMCIVLMCALVCVCVLFTRVWLRDDVRMDGWKIRANVFIHEIGPGHIVANREMLPLAFARQNFKLHIHDFLTITMAMAIVTAEIFWFLKCKRHSLCGWP